MTYTVKKGDTLTAIASKYNCTVADLASANGIKNPNLIHVGDVLTIPNKTDVKKAVLDCLEAIEKLPEFKALKELIGV